MEYFLIVTSLQLQDKGHNYESYIFGVMPLFKLSFLNKMMIPDRRGLVPHALLILLNYLYFILVSGSISLLGTTVLWHLFIFTQKRKMKFSRWRKSLLVLCLWKDRYSHLWTSSLGVIIMFGLIYIVLRVHRCRVLAWITFSSCHTYCKLNPIFKISSCHLKYSSHE